MKYGDDNNSCMDDSYNFNNSTNHPPSPFNEENLSSSSGKIDNVDLTSISVSTPSESLEESNNNEANNLYKNDTNNDWFENDIPIYNQQEENETNNINIEDLSWRVAKLRLEEENKRRFLKSGPRFLPYDECRKWVKAWNRWDCEDDWRRWVEDGEKRNPYIPGRPDEYYGRLNQWRGWDHFLGKELNGDFNYKDEDAFQ